MRCCFNPPPPPPGPRPPGRAPQRPSRGEALDPPTLINIIFPLPPAARGSGKSDLKIAPYLEMPAESRALTYYRENDVSETKFGRRLQAP
ncbi:hypothetical protein EVAR_59157_1 [Eumeta japonica]|uniref:Uncharacterized protein n=1 Tax=Eumeta variegata TaxID=151549 RepID=A0A4C1YWY4_EUMVA|nr:hypothetical protein EVAR_59157_1 [Eumeta japonica]